MSGFAPIAQIQASVAAYYYTPKRLMVSDDRTGGAAFVRQVAMYLAHDLLGKSKSAIGRAFKKDRTTVTHGIQKIAERIDRDPRLAHDLATLRARIDELSTSEHTEKRLFGMRNSLEYGKEHSANMQEKRIAA